MKQRESKYFELILRVQEKEKEVKILKNILTEKSLKEGRLEKEIEGILIEIERRDKEIIELDNKNQDFYKNILELKNLQVIFFILI
jgi:hypothetical protein